MRIRNLILDWSGTMVDDFEPVWLTTNHVLAAHGRPPLTREAFRHEFCLPVRVCYARWLPGVPLDRLEALFMAKYPEHRHCIRPLPQTEPFLQFCAAAGLPVYVASTADPHTYETQMARYDLHRYITRSYLGIEDKTARIHHLLAENRLAPAETLFVGDMEHDIAAGKAGGVRTCAVLSGYNHADKLQAAGPDLVCAHLGELQQHLATAAAVAASPLAVRRQARTRCREQARGYKNGGGGTCVPGNEL